MKLLSLTLVLAFGATGIMAGSALAADPAQTEAELTPEKFKASLEGLTPEERDAYLAAYHEVTVTGNPTRETAGERAGIIVQGPGNLEGRPYLGPEGKISPEDLKEMEKVGARGDQLREQLGGDEPKVFEQLQREFPEYFHEMKEGDIEPREWERLGTQMERFGEEMERDREEMERHREEMERGRDEAQREIESTERPTMERPEYERSPQEFQYEGGH